jgi:hypothetical protein
MSMNGIKILNKQQIATDITWLSDFLGIKTVIEEVFRNKSANFAQRKIFPGVERLTNSLRA